MIESLISTSTPVMSVISGDLTQAYSMHAFTNFAVVVGFLVIFAGIVKVYIADINTRRKMLVDDDRAKYAVNRMVRAYQIGLLEKMAEADKINLDEMLAKLPSTNFADNIKEELSEKIRKI